MHRVPVRVVLLFATLAVLWLTVGAPWKST